MSDRSKNVSTERRISKRVLTRCGWQEYVEVLRGPSEAPSARLLDDQLAIPAGGSSSRHERNSKETRSAAPNDSAGQRIRRAVLMVTARSAARGESPNLSPR